MLDTEGWLGRDSPHMRTFPPLPARVGPTEFGELGRLVAVRAPRELDDIFRRAGGTWEPGSRRWLIERRRIGPVIRAAQQDRSTVPANGRIVGLTALLRTNRARPPMRHAARRMRRRASSNSCIT